MVGLWGVAAAYVIGSLGVLVVLRRRTPSNATPEQGQANRRVVVGLMGLGYALAIGVGLYFAR